MGNSFDKEPHSYHKDKEGISIFFFCFNRNLDNGLSFYPISRFLVETAINGWRKLEHRWIFERSPWWCIDIDSFAISDPTVDNSIGLSSQSVHYKLNILQFHFILEWGHSWSPNITRWKKSKSLASPGKIVRLFFFCLNLLIYNIYYLF